MKSLTKFIFCIFVLKIIFSCEPEDLLEEVNEPVDVQIDLIGSTGNQGDVIDDDKE